jgi:hypothetical protein
MARTWEAKAPTEVVERRWTVPLDDNDSISSVSTSASGVTVDSDEHEDGEAIVTLSAGAAGATGSVTVTVTTSEGLTLVETFLIAIAATAQQFTYTARDVCNFALRKITGNGNDPEASEAEDALERLNDMLALWRIDGLDVGVPAPLALGDTLTIPDQYVSAVKFNLRIACHDAYDAPITAYDARMAEDGKRLVANQLNVLADLTGPFGLSSRSDTVADLF